VSLMRRRFELGSSAVLAFIFSWTKAVMLLKRVTRAGVSSSGLVSGFLFSPLGREVEVVLETHLLHV